MPGGANGIGGRANEGGPIGGIIPMPRPAGIPRPGPIGSAFFLSSSTTGGGPSTLKLTTVSPLKITSPRALFISCSGADSSPGFFLGPYPSELLTIRQYQVHVAIKSKHLASQRPSIVDRNFESPVDETQHFSTFRFWGRL